MRYFLSPVHVGLLAALAISTAGCASQAVAEPRAPVPTPTIANPTPQVTFHVAVTSLPILRPRRRPLPHPRATPFVPPAGPYIRLVPDGGPPVTRTIAVRAGNLQPSSPVQLVWSPGGHASAIARTVYTDRKGNVSAPVLLPGSPPGVYDLVAETNDVPYASAIYTVRSSATISVTIMSNRGGAIVQVVGKRFLAQLHLLLIADPFRSGEKQIVLGSVQTDGRGRFRFVSPSALAPGQYVLRALSTSAVSEQMVEAFFEVVV